MNGLEITSWEEELKEQGTESLRRRLSNMLQLSQNIQKGDEEVMMIKRSVGPDTERGQDGKTTVIKSKESLEFRPWSCLCGFLFWL